VAAFLDLISRAFNSLCNYQLMADREDAYIQFYGFVNAWKNGLRKSVMLIMAEFEVDRRK